MYSTIAMLVAERPLLMLLGSHRDPSPLFMSETLGGLSTMSEAQRNC